MTRTEADQVVARHEAVKLDGRAWAALPFVGLQDLGDGTALELRNCTCCPRPQTMAVDAERCPACGAHALEPAGPDAVLCRGCCGLTFRVRPDGDA